MRKLLLLLITLCLHIAARGQTFISLDEVDLSGIPQATSAKALRYWFDDGAGGVQTTTHLQGQHLIDASTLTDGLHTLHYQIVDNTDVVAITNSVLFLKTGSMSASVSASQLRYWFDDNDSSVNSVNGTSGSYMLNGSSLTEGLHTLHYQAVDTQGTASIPRSTVFLKYSSLAAGISAKQLRYWFDDDAQTVATVAIPDGIQTIDAHELVDGLHTLHYQVTGVDGVVYNMASALFLKMEENNTETDVTARMLMYWFDDDTTVSSVELSQGVQVLDASSLVDGLHTIHYQVLCSNGQMTSTKSTVFLRMNIDEESSVAQSLRYWFDDQQTAKEIALAEGVQLLDVSAVEDGLHTVHYQIADNKGMLASPVSSVFLKMDSKASTAEAKSLRYWFDDNATSVKVVDVTKGSQALDVSGLVSGLHTLYYQLIDADGKVSSPVAYIFMRDFDKLLADGKNAITRYQYWLNANSEAMETVELSSASNPYSLIALLPMQKEPIRTQQFRFEVTDGQPTIYAENTFNIRFHDATGYFADAYKPFVDYSVKQEVTDAEWLESGIRQTTAKPVDNEIRWYILEAEPGDSVQFRLDRAATIQLFSPSGEEVLKASGADVVNWYGKHVRESGTYYLALHDVTATYGNTISIDYNHIDKYAVLRQDVSVVGNGGCSTITFEGNGFRDLYAVSLFTEKGDSIHHIYIGHESDAETSVVFDFTDVPLGQYNALFRFTGEDKVFNSLVTVEEARDIELATTVTFPATFLLSTGKNAYTAKITNKGNMTSYKTPIYIYIASHEKDGIGKIKVDGLKLPKIFDTANLDSLTTEDLQRIINIQEKLGETHYFVQSSVLDYNSNDSLYIWAAYFFADIAPDSEKKIDVNVFTDHQTEVWFTVPQGNSPLSGEAYSEIDSSKFKIKKMSREEYCCMRSKIECIASIVADGVGIANTVASLTPGCPHQLALGVADCVVGAINQVVQSTGKVLCNQDDYEENFWDRVQRIMNGISVVNTLTTCASNILPAGKFKELVKAINELSGNNFLTAFSVGVDIGNCALAFTEQIPNCPPDNKNGGGTSRPVASVDPNDIYGYTAESGSHAVKDGLTDVYYRIEFENDTTFATAPAHDIWLTDTLDTSKFDLSSFTPTRIKIGEKMSELSGDKNFVQTVDLRPEVNAIAQIEGTFDEKKGIARWHISSLDPMTMEPTKYVTDGVLPVNTDGRGIGELSFYIKLRDDLAHGTEIKNRAGIVFDSNDVIMTPYWTNVVDRIAPESRITDVVLASDSTAAVSIEAYDELSGPWRYDVYVQYGTGSAWWKAAENVPIDSTALVKVYDDMDHGFYVVVTDSAGNVEQKDADREFTLPVGQIRIKGDVNGDKQVGIADIVAVTSFMAGTDSQITLEDADVNGDAQVGIADIIYITDIMAGTANKSSKSKKRFKTYMIKNKQQ